MRRVFPVDDRLRPGTESGNRVLVTATERAEPGVFGQDGPGVPDRPPRPADVILRIVPGQEWEIPPPQALLVPGVKAPGPGRGGRHGIRDRELAHPDAGL